jgi:hypothetical protein
MEVGKVRSLLEKRVVIPALDEAQMAFSQVRITIHDLVRSATSCERR